MDIAHLLSGNDEGNWCTIAGTEKDAKPSQLRVKRLKPKEIDDITEECTAKSFRRGKVTESLDTRKYMKTLLYAALLEWKHVDVKKKPLDFTKENIALCDDNWIEFRETWSGVVLGWQETEAVMLEEDRKNL